MTSSCDAVDVTCRYWLHPQRFRTEMCQFGAKCNRPVCFCAHFASELRVSTSEGLPYVSVAFAVAVAVAVTVTR
jgi:hypothetical protein